MRVRDKVRLLAPPSLKGATGTLMAEYTDKDFFPYDWRVKLDHEPKREIFVSVLTSEVELIEQV